MLLRPANFLLLDEPTNHLDLRAKDVLLESLQEFSGTVVFVSHDRYFIDKLATKVFEIGGGEVHVFPGNYEDFLRFKQRESEAAADRVAVAPSPDFAAKALPVEDRADSANGARRINPQRLRQMQERCDELEEMIARTEAEIAACETALSSFVSVDETQRQTDLLQAKRGDLEALMDEWEELAATLHAAQ
jgi:ATP-binding cassette subfamily F protein 3